MQSFGRTTKFLLRSIGIKQSELAASLGMSKSGVSKMLGEYYDPKLSMVFKVADALNVSPSLFIADEYTRKFQEGMEDRITEILYNSPHYGILIFIEYFRYASESKDRFLRMIKKFENVEVIALLLSKYAHIEYESGKKRRFKKNDTIYIRDRDHGIIRKYTMPKDAAYLVCIKSANSNDILDFLVENPPDIKLL